jgi:carbon monoxide dehydrogenase subunit G
MELTNEFRVAAPVAQAWPLLTNIERIAPCVPGFKLSGVEADAYQGVMKIKVGAVQMSYDCAIRFVECDDAAHRAVISATGRELRGQGGVTATITSNLRADGDGTHVSVLTELNVTGRVAQFGRNILAEVSDRLVQQFVRKLETQLLAPATADADAAGTAAGTAAPGPQPTSTGAAVTASGTASEGDDDEPLNLLSVAAGPLARRVAPFAATAVLLAFVVAVVRMRSGR